jgi:hypothetical protein
VLTVSPELAEDYLTTAEALATQATAGDIVGLAGCDPQRVGADACARTFIAGFGRRAYRRPLAPDEVDLYFRLYQAGADFKNGVRLVVQAFLQAAPFLYRVELGTPVAGAPGLVQLNAWELASRLSYLLWGTMPDDALLAAAEQGRLSAPADVAAQVARMLADARAHDVLADFADQWLGLRDLANVDKDARAYPAFGATTAADMREEASRFLDDVLWHGKGDLGTLLSANWTFVNASLAKTYGLPAPSGTGFARVSLDARRAGGILTLGPVMTLAAKPNQSSPVKRGKLIREQFLCDELPDPPPTVPQLPVPSPNVSTRERFLQHSSDPACAGCHHLIDPLGVAFENYDGVGHWRDVDGGKPVDTRGAVVGTDFDGDNEGPVALAAKVAGSGKARRCVVTQLFRRAVGRGESDADRCTLQVLDEAFVRGGFRLQDVVAAVSRTDAFRFRATGAGNGGAP